MNLLKLTTKIYGKQYERYYANIEAALIYLLTIGTEEKLESLLLEQVPDDSSYRSDQRHYSESH